MDNKGFVGDEDDHVNYYDEVDSIGSGMILVRQLLECLQR